LRFKEQKFSERESLHIRWEKDKGRRRGPVNFVQYNNRKKGEITGRGEKKPFTRRRKKV